MKLHLPFKKNVLSGLLAVIVIAAACVFAPAPAQADAYVAYVEDASGYRINFTSWNDIADDLHSGDTLVMLADLNPAEISEWADDTKSIRSLSIDEGVSATIDMNGHKIIGRARSGNDQATCIVMKSGSSLTLKSSKPSTEFKYMGCMDSESTKEMSLTAGGLITGGSAKDGGGVCMGDDCHLTLDGVAIAGNKGWFRAAQSKHGSGGGIHTGYRCSVDLKNGATIQDNYAYAAGGGIYADGEDVVVTLDNATICNNSSISGGGICFGRKNCTLTSKEGKGVVSNNAVTSSAGAVYFSGSGGLIEGVSLKDNKSTKYAGAVYSFYENTTIRNCTISGNSSAEEGGAIYFRVDDNTIEGCTITGNSSSSYGGGGIYLNGKSSIVDNCSITGNSSLSDGGGIYLNGKNNTIKNCSITGNSSDKDGGGLYLNATNTIEGCSIRNNWCGGAYEGGGAFVSYRYDVTMLGVCIVKNNTRGKGTDNWDDIFLNTISGQTGFAYITGGVSKGSSVGVRTPNEGDRRIGNKVNNETTDCFFIDLEGYYVSYGSDHGGDMWQRHTTKEFAVKVNDTVRNRCRNGSTVTLNGATTDASKVFKSWVAEGSTGLYPFSDYVADADLTNPVLSFTMPQNDVNLVASYVDRRSALKLTVQAPVAGESLPTTGTLSWDSDKSQWENLPVTWLVNKGGAWQPASGVAEYGASYRAALAVDQASALERDLAFALDLVADNQQAVVGGAAVGVASASVDASGALTMRTNTVQTAKPAVIKIEKVEITVEAGSALSDLKKKIPGTVTAALDSDGTASLSVAKDGDYYSELVDSDTGKIKKPESGDFVTLRLPVSSADGAASVPSSLSTVEVKVTVTGESAPAKPETPGVDRDQATYSTTDDAIEFEKDGRLKITATCKTVGAAIKYRLNHCDDAWTDDTTVRDYFDGIYLEKKADGQRIYELEIWSVASGVESDHEWLLYVIDDMQSVHTVEVAVKQTDTGEAPTEKKLGTYDVKSGESFSIVAPTRSGYAFERWQDENGGDLGSSPTLKLESVTEARTVVAVYNPVVSGLDVYLEIPEADKPLVKNATQVKAEIGESEGYADVTDYFASESEGVAIDWTPSAQVDTKAAHDTCYTASLALDAAVSGGVKYVLSPAASVLINGNDVYGGAYVLERDGETSVCVECPNTGPAEYKSTGTLADIELSYKEALVAKTSQAEDGLAAAWGLPLTVKVAYDCKETEDYEIAWDSITALDESETGAQVLTATGAISFADHGYVSHDGDTETVTVRVRVAAPEKKDDGKKDEDSDKKGDPDDGEDDSDKDGGDKSDTGDRGGDADESSDQKRNETKATTTTVTTVTTSVDSALAATGDRAPLIVGVLVTLGILVAAAGILAKRKKR